MFEVFVKVTSKTVWCKRKLVQTFFILLFLGGGSYTLKLAFSPSSSISPTAPTVAPAVAAAAVAAEAAGAAVLVSLFATSVCAQLFGEESYWCSQLLA